MDYTVNQIVKMIVAYEKERRLYFTLKHLITIGERSSSIDSAQREYNTSIKEFMKAVPQEVRDKLSRLEKE